MSAMVACPRCGAPNSLGNLFCSNCGVPLTASVPPGLFPSPAKLAILTSGGAIALAPTPFASLNYPSQRAAYVQSQPGGPVAVGDRLLLSTTTYSAGSTYQISDSTSILAAGMLR